MKKEKMIFVGKIIGTFGIKGELKVYSESDFLAYRFRKDATIFLVSKKEQIKVNVLSMRKHKNNVLLSIHNLNDINLVEKYIGYDIYVDALDVPPLKDDEYQLDNLIDLDVYDEEDYYLGKVVDFIEVPQGYIMDVRNEGKKTLIPFVDEFIIDILEDKIIVKVIEICQ